jgi:predicted P-loop ATPase
MAGATNNRDIFQDPTGKRRFLPIVVVGKIPARENRRLLTIDLDGLKHDRDSIWAAAYQAYLAGEFHVFTSYELEMISGYLSGFTADSPVENRVTEELTRSSAGHIKGRRYTTLSELCRTLDIPLDRQNSMKLSITDALKRAGWTMKQIRVFGKLTRVWLEPERRVSANHESVPSDAISTEWANP